jgi:hypothetical protein
MRFIVWIKENSELANLIVNFLFVVIWGVYLHLIYKSFQEQHTPKIIINQSLGFGTSSLCTLSNMSKEPVHINCVVLSVSEGDVEETIDVTDYIWKHPEEQDALKPNEVTKLGPLESGGLLSLGTFHNLLQQAIRKGDHEDNKADVDLVRQKTKIEIRLVFTFSFKSHLLGAKRVFCINQSGDQMLLIPESFETEHLTNRRGQETARGWLEKCKPT